MRKRDYLYSLIVIAGFSFAFSAFNSPAASAYIHATPPYQDPAFETELTNLLSEGTAADGITPPPGSIAGDLYGAGELGGLWPGVGIIAGLGAILTAGVGLDIGWKIGRGIDTQYLHLRDPQCVVFGCPSVPSGTPVVTSVSTFAPTGDPNFAPEVSGVKYMGISDAQTPNCAATNWPASFWPEGTYTGSNSQCLQYFNVDAPHFKTALLAAGWSEAVWPGCGAGTTNFGGIGGFTSGACYELYRPINDERKAIQSPPVKFTNQAFQKTTTITAPGSLSATQLAAIQANIAGLATTTQDWVDCLIDPADYICPDGSTVPGYSPSPTTTTLPYPTPNQTYSDYVTELRAKGYLGNIVILDDPGYALVSPYATGSPALQLSPGTVTGVGVGSALPVGFPLYDPSTGQPKPQPNPMPTLQLQTTPTAVATPSVVVMRVPATYSPPASSPSPTGAPTPPPGSNSCNLPTIKALDMSPLTGLAFGNKFPFGVFGWVTTVIGYFNVTPVTPEVNLNMSGLSSFVPGFSAVYHVKLDYFDTYMSGIRDLLSFALWVGAIWYIGVTLLGFRGGGDMSDAADDGMPDV